MSRELTEKREIARRIQDALEDRDRIDEHIRRDGGEPEWQIVIDVDRSECFPVKDEPTRQAVIWQDDKGRRWHGERA